MAAVDSCVIVYGLFHSWSVFTDFFDCLFVCLFWYIFQAAYTVGGHSFSAAAIEYVILKMKPPLHRPQIVWHGLVLWINYCLIVPHFLIKCLHVKYNQALLLALHKLKVSDEQLKSAVDIYEPLVTFALSCGMYSSPAVISILFQYVDGLFHFKFSCKFMVENNTCRWESTLLRMWKKSFKKHNAISFELQLELAAKGGY